MTNAKLIKGRWVLTGDEVLADAAVAIEGSRIIETGSAAALSRRYDGAEVIGSEHSAVLPAPEDVDFYRPTLDVLWDAFGEDRLVYGSNWPNVEQIGPYSQELGITSAYFGEKGGDAAEKFLWGNAKTAYKWIDRSQEVSQQ